MPDFYYILLPIAIGILWHLLTGSVQQSLPSFDYRLTILLAVLAALLLAFLPVDPYSDKNVYLHKFEFITFDDLATAKDTGWAYYTFYVKSFFGSADIYMLLTSCIYLSGYYIFARKFISPSYSFVFVYASIVSFGFYSYGVNTLRAGFALSLLLVAMSQYKKSMLAVLLAGCAVLMHKSVLLPAGAFFLTRLYNKPKAYIIFWLGCLALSFANVSAVSNVLTPLLAGDDDRLQEYINLGDQNTNRYKTGFRYDFVVYSAVPIALGLYYILKIKVKDILYDRFLNTYLLANAVWLLVIRMAFTDRVAYLSWFLMPFLLLYPLLKYKLPLHQRLWTVAILSGIFGFTMLMYLK